jgi:hypothetical protein
MSSDTGRSSTTPLLLRAAVVSHRSTALAGTWLPRQVAVVFDARLREEDNSGPPLDGLVAANELL